MKFLKKYMIINMQGQINKISHSNLNQIIYLN